MSPRRSLLWLGALATIGITSLGLGEVLSAPPLESDLKSPRYDEAFRKHWHDGFAELAGYDLSFRRYGVDRKGTAITIFVTETFSNSARVKADPGQHPDSDTFPVMKLNLIQDFPTGVYDYNVMMSNFLALSSVNGRPAGTATKVSFSSQEWCGHVYQQVLFKQGGLFFQSHSYFDGEGDESGNKIVPTNAITEDSLFHWARGFAAPAVKPGESVQIQVLRSLEEVRLKHVSLDFSKATLSCAAKTKTVEAPVGKIECFVMTAAIAKGRTWTFHTEKAFPHRLIGWDRSDGVKARLIKSDRMKYWELNGAGGEKALERLGLKPRGARKP